jgi:UDP-N-acetyl-D-mannosaminuronate dehydrogenase
MNIGFVGLGKLGLPCALAIEQRGHKVVGVDPSPLVSRVIESKSMAYLEEG